MTTTVTKREFGQRVYDALDDQNHDAFAARSADGSLLYNGDEDFQRLDAVSQNSPAPGHGDIACQGGRRHVSR